MARVELGKNAKKPRSSTGKSSNVSVSAGIGCELFGSILHGCKFAVGNRHSKTSSIVAATSKEWKENGSFNIIWTAKR